jgi:hypothetical protein
MAHPPASAPLSPEQKQAFRDAARPPAARLSDKARIREVWPSIRQKRQEGWSYEEVRQALEKTVGFQGTLKTLYRYVWQLSKEPGTASPLPVAPLPAALMTGRVGDSATRSSGSMPVAPGMPSSQKPGRPEDLTIHSTSRQEASHQSLVDRMNAPP